MRYFPMFLDMRERRVVVVGGGEEALRKVRLLLKSEAIVTLVADKLHPELDGLVSHGAVAWLGIAFEDVMLDGAALVFVAADEALEQTVSTAARARGIPVNVVDRADLSTAITPAIVDRDPLVIAIGTEGAAPVLGQGIRQEIEAMLPPRLGALARRAVALRPKVAGRFEQGAPRRDFWRRFFFGTLRDSFLGRDRVEFETALAAELDLSPKSRTGRVALVGAGPGDPELLTLKAQRKLHEADVIVHDRLIGPGILEYARRDAIRVPVGKTPGKPSPSQSAINAILIEEAGKGLNVVRLKGGDPYVFGRGGEEQAALEAAGIPVEIVPGVTAALGCAASIGLPVTQRGRNTAITLITGASEDGFAEHDWAALARPGAASAVYMGVGAAPHIAARLADAGIDSSTPVTIVENGTLPDERVIETTVARLAQAARGVSGPAIIFIGLGRERQSAAVVPFPAPAATAVQIERRAS
jgi:uroporphyrin-III C-methyltransferase/precorrin-2 dehydrogenase/sirohydrochlorin ferrochelatase